MVARSAVIGVLAVLGGAIEGVGIAIPLYLLGIVVSAQGQLLKASLDVAVHISPFLHTAEKAKVISLD